MFGITTEDACELMRESGVSAKGKRAANADELWTAFLGDYKLPELAVFRAGFERVQTELMDLIHSVDKLPEEKKVGARRGLAAMLQQMHERIGGGENA